MNNTIEKKTTKKKKTADLHKNQKMLTGWSTQKLRTVKRLVCVYFPVICSIECLFVAFELDRYDYAQQIDKNSTDRIDIRYLI